MYVWHFAWRLPCCTTENHSQYLWRASTWPKGSCAANFSCSIYKPVFCTQTLTLPSWSEATPYDIHVGAITLYLLACYIQLQMLFKVTFTALLANLDKLHVQIRKSLNVCPFAWTINEPHLLKKIDVCMRLVWHCLSFAGNKQWVSNARLGQDYHSPICKKSRGNISLVPRPSIT